MSPRDSGGQQTKREGRSRGSGVLCKTPWLTPSKTPRLREVTVLTISSLFERARRETQVDGGVLKDTFLFEVSRRTVSKIRRF
jgi:hypothetical protein